MNARVVITLAALVAAAAAWGADITVTSKPAAAPAGPQAPNPRGTDGTMELKWDSGSPGYYIQWYTGSGAWVMNQFDTATISGYNHVDSVRFYAQSPGTGRIKVASGSQVWGPEFRTCTAAGWNELSVDWTLPGGATDLGVYWEQFYNYPSGLGFYLDGQNGTGSHSWYYYNGWYPITSLGYGNRAVLLRAVVSNNSGVAPSSLGRVKALYF